MRSKETRRTEAPIIRYSKEPVIIPKAGCDWADTMVLNPAIIEDPTSDEIHMLFRATGPWPQKNLKGLSDPYPIFLGYAVSKDQGETWEADFDQPALAPALAYDLKDLYIEDDEGNTVVNYANGCIEDPRIFWLENELYVTAACRLFPPGPYWEGNKRRDNLPDWAMEEDNPLGSAAYRNDTTTVLFKLNLERLKEKDYERAFQYVCRLTDGNVSDNRDVFLFPQKLRIHGKLQYVMLHRPNNPDAFEVGKGIFKPSMFLAAAENIKDFEGSQVTHEVLATSRFDWEEERIGASFPPIKIAEGEWLISYHGKKLPKVGYTQSFMILQEQEDGFPTIIHRCSERLMYAKQEWEMPDKFACPCIFTTGGIVKGDELMMSYGAADQKIGMAWTKLDELVDYIRTFDWEGNKMQQREVIRRYENNPILEAKDVPYSATLIFNAGVAKYQGRYVMMFRNDYNYTKTGPFGFEGTN
ncbi:MAG: hypothetical protein JW708_06720, partial [Vallitaleaceae bacterium]|nr:hypothetical protein [Vallitaleaceae bacterium]